MTREGVGGDTEGKTDSHCLVSGGLGAWDEDHLHRGLLCAHSPYTSHLWRQNVKQYPTIPEG